MHTSGMLAIALFDVLFVAAVSSAGAAELFASRPLPTLASERSGVAVDPSVPFGNGTGFQYFILPPGPQTVREVSLYGFYENFLAADDFQFKVYSSIGELELGDSPSPKAPIATASVLRVDRVNTGISPALGPATYYHYTVYIADLNLPGDTPLWFATTNNTGGRWALAMGTRYVDPPEVDAVLDSRSSGDFRPMNRANDINRKTSWFPLALSDDVHNIPEPSSYVLGAFALAGLAVLRVKVGFRTAGR